MLTLLTVLGVFLFCSNSPRIRLLFSLILSFLGRIRALLQGRGSLYCIMGLLVFAGGLFVIISFVVFSTSFDFDIPFWNIGVLTPIIFVSIFRQDLPPLQERGWMKVGGEYLIPFVFVLVILLFLLFRISSFLEEKREKISN